MVDRRDDGWAWRRGDTDSRFGRARFWIAALVALLSFGMLALDRLAERPGDWLLTLARAPATLQNPERAEAGWLAPAIDNGTALDLLGAAIAATIMIGLIALHIRQQTGRVLAAEAEDAECVYKFVTNPTKGDDRRIIGWEGWAPGQRREGVESVVC
jgi:hypothetical protein